MQSAFVDVGLERDAFLYVTDFLEMEDQEDTDEVERATTQGTPVRQQPQTPQANQQSVQQSVQQPAQAAASPSPNEGRREGRANRESRDDRSRRNEPRTAPEEQTQQPAPRHIPTQATVAEPVIPASVVEATEQQDETDEQGARRWRGRRRRRGGRGRDETSPKPTGQNAQIDPIGQAAPIEESEAEDGFPVELTEFEEEEELDFPTMDFEASAATTQPQEYDEASEDFTEPKHPAPPTGAAPVPFLLPGESLSKYGASVVKPQPSRLVFQELPPDTAPPPPDRTATKPSTLIETEIVWDGKGLLPGESLARHRKSEPTPPPAPTPSAQVHAEPSGVFSDAAPAHQLEAFAEPEAGETSRFETDGGIPAPEEFVELDEFVEIVPETPAASATEIDADQFEETEETEDFESEEFDESELPAFESSELEPAEPLAAAAPEHYTSAEASEEGIANHHSAAEPEPDASASHNVDPLPPSAFRFTDLFGSKKKESAPAPAPAPEPKPARPVSTYAPGAGHLEEELIEEEEYEINPLKAHHHDDSDHDDLEEETLQQQIRSGALGELLHEAQLEGRMRIESADDDESEEDEEGAPATSGGRGQGAQGQGGRNDGRNDRNRGRGRGRDGREARPGAPATSGDPRRGGPSRRSAQTSDLPIISDLLKPGQEILVQIAKEPIAKKGARITSHIALPGRFLVFMPTVSHVGVSRKIASDEERNRLKRILVSEKGEAQGGFIVRTAAEGATEEELRADLRFLINLWNEIKMRAETSKPPALIYHDLNLIERILRDQISDNFSHIWVDSEADYERIVRFLNRFSPELVRRVKLYTKEVPLFEHFGIQDEISKALRSKVWLKSGGSIVINQTEALVAIDINTGKFVGKTARLEDTILKTNLDAIPEIVRQVRLRDLGGIIVIDFIDMDERKNRTRVLAALEEALKQDRAPTKVLQFNDFGLVAITRKRVKQSLERTLSVPCPVCQATGMVKSPVTVANEIYIEVRKMRKHFDQPEVLLRVNPETAKALKANNARWLTDLEELAGRNVLIKNDATLHPEQFDIQG